MINVFKKYEISHLTDGLLPIEVIEQEIEKLSKNPQVTDDEWDYIINAIRTMQDYHTPRPRSLEKEYQADRKGKEISGLRGLRERKEPPKAQGYYGQPGGGMMTDPAP